MVQMLLIFLNKDAMDRIKANRTDVECSLPQEIRGIYVCERWQLVVVYVRDPIAQCNERIEIGISKP